MKLENETLSDLHTVMEGVALRACDLMINEPENKEMVDHYLQVYREYRMAYNRKLQQHFRKCEEWQRSRGA